MLNTKTEIQLLLELCTIAHYSSWKHTGFTIQISLDWTFQAPCWATYFRKAVCKSLLILCKYLKWSTLYYRLCRGVSTNHQDCVKSALAVVLRMTKIDDEMGKFTVQEELLIFRTYVCVSTVNQLNCPPESKRLKMQKLNGFLKTSNSETQNVTRQKGKNYSQK